nr:hypothetical protein [Tissierella sp.]
MLEIGIKILRKFVEFKVLRSIPGRMRLKSRAPESIYKQAEKYDRELKEAIMLLDGIENIEINYLIGTVLIEYNTEKTYESKVLEWINKIIAVGIKNKGQIAEYLESDREYLENLLEQQLKEEISKL